MTSFEGNSCCFTPDGETLVYGLRGKGEGSPGKIEFRSAKTLKVQPTLEAEAVIVTAHHPTLALSGDGKVLATSNQDHAVQLWNLPARKLMAVLKGHERAIASIAFSADGTRVATSSYDGSIRLWALIPR